MTPKKLPWLALLVLLVPACLENEEDLEVHPDGSLEVTLASEGDLADLEDGFPIPLGGPWLATSPDAQTFGLRPSRPEDKKTEKRLEVRARFDSVAELPRRYAPASETYHEAYLARDTSLSIDEQAGGGRVFVFERVYRGFERSRLDPLRRVELPEDLEQRLDNGTLSASDRAQVMQLVAEGHELAAEALAREALLGFFLQGRRELAASEVPGVIAEIAQASSRLVEEGRIELLLALVENEDDSAGEELEALEKEWRETLRATLEASLANRGVPEALRNAAAFALEWQLAAVDQYEDLGDEAFTLRVRLPGTIVGGNFERVEDGRALFEFDGEVLQAGDVVLRAVSVLE